MPGFYTDLAASIAGQASPNSLATALASGIGPREILGSNLINWWDSAAGIGLVSGAVDTWTDQIGGVIVQAPAAANRCVYAADTGYFRERSVVQTSATGPLYLYKALAATIWQVGAFPYVACIHRQRTTTADNARVVQVGRGGSTDVLLQHTSYAATMIARIRGTAALPSLTNAATAIANLSESWSDGANQFLSLNGAASTSTALVGGLPLAQTSMGIGATSDGTGGQPGNMSIRHIMFCTAVPTAALRAALLRYARGDSGTP